MQQRWALSRNGGVENRLVGTGQGRGRSPSAAAAVLAVSGPSSRSSVSVSRTAATQAPS